MFHYRVRIELDFVYFFSADDLKKSFEFIDEALSRNVRKLPESENKSSEGTCVAEPRLPHCKVLIFCESGDNLSAAVAVYYFMRECSCSLQDALKRVQAMTKVRIEERLLSALESQTLAI